MSRPAAWILIDGHNLIHAAPALRAIGGSAETARAALEELLAGLRRGGSRVAVFYDGGPGGEIAVRHRRSLEAHYSGTAEADDVLIAWLRARPGVRAVAVTDDRGLGARARTLGARVMGCDELLGMVREPRPDERVQPALDAAEVAEWMRIFGIEEEAEEEGN